MSAPLCIDLFCGLGGWTSGFLAEGYDVIGFDVEQHIYGEHHYPAQLVLQDVRTLHGSQFKNAAIIVASSPCQEFSYRAMPWKRAKALGPPELGMELFAQAGRIQREACEAAGRYIPMIQENVRGAQKYVGRANWHYGSYYLWGDVPALMPAAFRTAKGRLHGWTNGTWESDGTKGSGGSWYGTYAERKARWDGNQSLTSSKSKARKAAAAKIAKIPFPLAQYIARVYREAERAA